MGVKSDLGGFLFIRNGIGSAHHIVGVGVVCQGEAGAGAGHLIVVQRQHIHRLKSLIINQAYLLLTDSTAYSAAATPLRRHDINSNQPFSSIG